MTQTPPPATIRVRSRLPLPNPKLQYTLSGRRGRCEDARAAVLPTADHHGQRALFLLAPNPTQTNYGCEFMQPLPLPHPKYPLPLPSPLLSLNPRPTHRARLPSAATTRRFQRTSDCHFLGDLGLAFRPRSQKS